MEIKILIVDDVKANLISLRALLEDINENYHILEANNGTEALEISLSQKLDLIILDIQMPDIDGFEVAKLLKGNKSTQDIPVVFLTAAFKSDEFVNRGFELGAVDYLTKPIDENQFINRISLYTKLIIKIQENREKDKALYQQTKMASMGEMIGNIAHQWRQPLSLISTAATGIKVKRMFGMSDEKFELECLDKINDTAQHLSQTIDDFRDFVKGDVNMKVFNLKKAIKKTLKIEDSIITNKSIAIIEDIDESIDLNNYENQLIQIFINIINNSKDALVSHDIEKKYISISAKRVNDKAIITFKDNGGGIPENIIHRVFEAYFTTKHKTQGTGLGLYMSYKMINTQLKGKISIQNDFFIHEDIQYKGVNVTIELDAN